MGIVTDIINGTATWEQIYVHNIAVLERMTEDERNNRHNPNDCGKKYCKHGNRRAVKQMEAHLETLRRELRVIRAGVTPSTVR